MSSAEPKIRPLGDRVIIRVLEEKEQRHGSIIIPDSAKEKPQEGEIVSIGPGRLLKSGQYSPLEVKRGDRVLYGKYSGNEVSLGDEKYLMLRESDILAVI
ncbi:MAG: co-chaperone GroES [bacterium]